MDVKKWLDDQKSEAELNLRVECRCVCVEGRCVCGGKVCVLCVCPSTQVGHICMSVGPHLHLQSAAQCGGVPGPASEGL